MTKKLSPSQEDYLEAILALEKKHRVARVKDIADLLEVRMPSVSGALKQLREKELIDYEKNSYITLTEEGKRLATRVKERHTSLAVFFEEILLLDADTAQKEACAAEHAISQNTIKRLSRLSAYLKKQADAGLDSEAWKNIVLEPRDRSNDQTV